MKPIPTTVHASSNTTKRNLYNEAIFDAKSAGELPQVKTDYANGYGNTLSRNKHLLVPKSYNGANGIL